MGDTSTAFGFGTWIARVSVVRVVLNIDTFRKRRDIQVILPDMTTQRYVHVSPKGSGDLSPRDGCV